MSFVLIGRSVVGRWTDREAIRLRLRSRTEIERMRRALGMRARDRFALLVVSSAHHAKLVDNSDLVDKEIGRGLKGLLRC